MATDEKGKYEQKKKKSEGNLTKLTANRFCFSSFSIFPSPAAAASAASAINVVAVGLPQLLQLLVDSTV